MKVVLLCATQDEARDHAREAGLKPFSRDIIAPGSAASIDGLRLTEADLVIEFEGFRQRSDADLIVRSLQRSIRKAGDAGPIWRKAGAAA